MPFIPLFAQSQSASDYNILSILDTSTGSDGAIVSRRVYLQKFDGSYLVPLGTTTNYITWAYPTPNPITINVLNTDYALRLIIQWLDVSGNVLYEKIELAGFTAYNEYFMYQLTQNQTTNYQIPADTTYYLYKGKMRTDIDDGNQAILSMRDITGSQEAYDRASVYRLNENKFF